MNDDTIVHVEQVEIAAANTTLRAEIHSPGRDVAPAVVLIPDVHGVSPLYREIASRIATSGLRTLLLDIYSREGSPKLADFEVVQAWIANLPDARVMGDVDAAVRYLETRTDVARDAIAVMGFCLGGQYAMMAACRIAALSGCVAFYGMLRHGRPSPAKLPPPLETAQDLSCPLLGLFGADDPLIPPSDVEELRTKLHRSQKTFELHVFPGAGHAFVNDRRPDAFRPEAAAKAMDLAIDFLHRVGP